MKYIRCFILWVWYILCLRALFGRFGLVVFDHRLMASGVRIILCSGPSLGRLGLVYFAYGASALGRWYISVCKTGTGGLEFAVFMVM